MYILLGVNKSKTSSFLCHDILNLFFTFIKKIATILGKTHNEVFFYCGQTTKRGEGGRELPPDPLRIDEAQEKLPQK